MDIETAEDAAYAYKSFDGWQYADREAAWKWMFEQGRMAEREACAKVCDGHAADASFLYGDYANGCENEALACAAAIRMRSNNQVKADAL